MCAGFYTLYRDSMSLIIIEFFILFLHLNTTHCNFFIFLGLVNARLCINGRIDVWKLNNTYLIKMFLKKCVVI